MAGAAARFPRRSGSAAVGGSLRAVELSFSKMAQTRPMASLSDSSTIGSSTSGAWKVWKPGDRGCPVIAPLFPVPGELARLGGAQPVLQAIPPRIETPRRQESGAREQALLVLRLPSVETPELTIGAFEDDLVAVGFSRQGIKVQEEPALLAGVLEGEVGRNERIDERREPLLAVEDEVSWLRIGQFRPRTAEEDRREWRVIRVTS